MQVIAAFLSDGAPRFAKKLCKSLLALVGGQAREHAIGVASATLKGVSLSLS